MTGAVLPFTFALPWIVFAAVWVSVALVTIVIARAARPLLARIEAEQRATLLFALALLPMIVAALVAALGFSPRIGGVLIDAHCHADVGCGPHVPILHTTHARATLLAVLLVTAAGVLLWSVGGRLWRSVALGAALRSFAAASEREPFEIVESRERFAYCVGLFRPQLLVSRGLLELPAAQREAVLAHERAHLARRDNLRRWLAAVSLWPVPRRARAAVVADLAEASELACDRAASVACGRRSLEQALTSLAVLPANAAVSSGAEGIGRRLRALAEPPRVTLPPLLLGAVIVAFYTLCSWPALDAAHHGSELVLDWLE